MTQQTWYRGGRTAMAAYAHLMLDLTIARHAALPAGPKLLVANHPTTTDPVLVPLAVEEPMHILITGMCFRMPGLGGYLRRAGHVPVVAGQGHEAFEAALALLRAGRNVLIFPEGALSPEDGGLHELRSGSARLALLTGAPVIPVGIALEPECVRHIDIARMYLHGPYAMTVGGALRFSGDAADRAHVGEVSRQIRQRIGALAEQSAARLAQRPPRGAGAGLPLLPERC